MEKLKFFYIVALLLSSTMIKEIESDNRYCAASLDTIEYVDSCPLDKDDASTAAKKKNCEAKAYLQNCTPPAKFKYHCLIDEMEKHLLEVCAPEYYILGYCAEYNVKGGRIQEHYSTPCINVTPQCSYRYNSTEAYLYPGCYDVVTRSSEYISTGATTSMKYDVYITNSSNDNSNAYIRILFPVVVCIGITVFSFCWIRGMCRTHCSNRKGNDVIEAIAVVRGEILRQMEENNMDNDDDAISRVFQIIGLDVPPRGEVLPQMEDNEQGVENDDAIYKANVADEIAIPRCEVLLRTEKNEHDFSYYDDAISNVSLTDEIAPPSNEAQLRMKKNGKDGRNKEAISTVYVTDEIAPPSDEALLRMEKNKKDGRNEEAISKLYVTDEIAPPSDEALLQMVKNEKENTTGYIERFRSMFSFFIKP